jgi:REP element-mobilizing transposase RayT
MYFVTARTFQSRLLLRPGRQTNALVAGVLARAVGRAGVQLHGFVVMSNHVHLLVSAQGVKLSRFMQYFLGNTSKKVGRLVGWRGALWERRFSMQPVLDDAGAEGRLRYIVAHGVKEGLVRRAEEWPGLSCVPLLRDGGAMRAEFFSWTKRWEHGALVEGGAALMDARWAEPEVLTLTPLPAWVGLSEEERRERVEAMTTGLEEEYRGRFRRVKGAAAVQEERPQHRPEKTERRRAPPCFAGNGRAIREYLEKRRNWTLSYLEAAARLRSGTATICVFPEDAFTPSCPTQKVSGTFDRLAS